MTKKEKSYLEDLIEKRAEGKISETERTLLNGFIRAEFESAEWDATQMGSKDQVSAAMYHKIKNRNFRRPFRNLYAYAAAASIAVLVTAGLLLKPQDHSEKIFTLSTASAVDSVRLHDGTLIYLTANSVLKYPEHFGSGTREVSLVKGNAFFKVARDPEHPFVITSAGIKTKVLGTSFHIGIAKDRCNVTVVTGKVNVSSATGSVDLIPDEEAVYTASGLIKQKASDIFLYNWYKQDVELTDVPLEKVLLLLNFKYGVNFEPANQRMLNTRMTIYIKSHLPLQSLLNQINYITHLKFETHGNTITVTP